MARSGTRSAPDPYRQLTVPLLTYIRRLQSNIGPNDVITIVIPEFETKKMWHMLLHNQSGMLLRLRLLREKNIIITTVPLMLK